MKKSGISEVNKNGTLLPNLVAGHMIFLRMPCECISYISYTDINHEH